MARDQKYDQRTGLIQNLILAIKFIQYIPIFWAPKSYCNLFHLVNFCLKLLQSHATGNTHLDASIAC